MQKLEETLLIFGIFQLGPFSGIPIPVKQLRANSFNKNIPIKNALYTFQICSAFLTGKEDNMEMNNDSCLPFLYLEIFTASVTFCLNEGLLQLLGN